MAKPKPLLLGLVFDVVNASDRHDQNIHKSREPQACPPRFWRASLWLFVEAHKFKSTVKLVYDR